MPSVPPVEPPLTPPRDTGDAGARSSRQARRQGQRQTHRKKTLTRPALVLATAVLSAVALAVAINAEDGSHVRAATSKLGADEASASAMVTLPPALSTAAAPRKTAKPKPKTKPKARTIPTASTASVGAMMPTGDLPGWRLVYNTDFPGDSLPSGWGAYTGAPGGDQYGYWEPENVSVSGGELHLRTTPDSDPDDSGVATSGGVAFYGDPQTYGMYLVRAKGDDEPGLKMSDIALLWPEDNSWPPEVDFFEDSGGARQGFSASLHPGTDGNNCCYIVKSVPNNATQWHTYGVIWTSSSLTYTIDGRVWAVVHSSDLDGGSWPDIPMNLDLQSENLGSAQPGSIETMTVAWVAQYAQS